MVSSREELVMSLFARFSTCTMVNAIVETISPKEEPRSTNSFILCSGNNNKVDSNDSAFTMEVVASTYRAYGEVPSSFGVLFFMDAPFIYAKSFTSIYLSLTTKVTV
ncbi:hypothetical protein GOP47_0021994 [Adiantum capillus-veneris]|uniref:Uncharacterized protein n=1 Tax=Adiantum capillus-veneris TaxID=13818 RepID=A0A9D4U9D7_ADICA|nr:hypothetical protein GOP47_0021994 [Adiantum capillus-veneris]